MGIATSVVNAWKDGFDCPQSWQMREMVTILGTYRHGRSNMIAVGESRQNKRMKCFECLGRGAKLLGHSVGGCSHDRKRNGYSE
jgi:hypothetical protein